VLKKDIKIDSTNFSLENDIQTYLEKTTGKPVSLVFTKNSSSMISARTRGGMVSVRLHEMFLGAGKDVIQEIAGFIKAGKGVAPLVRQFINKNRDQIVKKTVRRAHAVQKGNYHDLQDMFNSLNEEYFEKRISSMITWGFRKKRYGDKQRRLGSYNMHTDTIRINPVLDKATVPHYFVEYVVYHEMLHADLGISEGDNGRRAIHTKEFRRRERLFSDYMRAITWEKRTGCKRIEMLS